MTKIDPATGLPELPEGYFWNIKENSIEILERLPPGEWLRTCDLDQFRKLPERFETRKDTGWKAFYYWRRCQVTGEYRELNQTEKARYERYGKWEASGWGWNIVEPDPVTKENIVERCTKVLNDWNEETERQKLYGHYPPNTFTQEVEDD